MALGKRKRTTTAAKRAGVYKAVGRQMRAKRGRLSLATLTRSVKRINSMVETKESCQVTGANISLPHNNIYNTGINPFVVTLGTGDPMAGTGNRIGDCISVRGLLIKGFLENAISRPKVHYRIMLLRGAKGETFDRTSIFKGIVGNKIIDQMNPERFTVVAQKKFTINCSSSAPSTVSATGVPLSGISSGTDTAGTGSRAFSMWVPGRKFGRLGTIRYENASTSQVKFYDYRIVILAYDWYGTPQDVNNVGKINEMYAKLYFKDA